MKPSLRQQIGESVRSILHAALGQQIAVPALLTYLQQKYAASEETVKQYIGTMQDVEQVSMQGTAINVYYCYSKEMQKAIERHERGEVRTIPIILRPCDWQTTPLSKLQALPKDGKPIITWSIRDNGYLDAAIGIRKAVEELISKPSK